MTNMGKHVGRQGKSTLAAMFKAAQTQAQARLLLFPVFLERNI